LAPPTRLFAAATVPRAEIDGMQKTYPPLTLENPQKSTISSGL
jgi:hypothetical protein